MTRQKIKICKEYIIKHSDTVFRLKRDNKNLSNEEYAENLISYLGSARKTSSISSTDLDNAISRITGCASAALTKNKEDSQNKGVPQCQLEKSFTDHQLQPESSKPGEHVAIFWVDNSNDIVWYLGIVDNVLDNNKINIIHLKRTDKLGHKWVLPEHPEVQPIHQDQILQCHILRSFVSHRNQQGDYKGNK